GVIRRWSSDVARSLDAIGLPSAIEVVARGRAARRVLGDYFRRLLPERRRRPQDDLLSLLIAAEEAGDTLSEGELLATCVLLFIAGHETTVNLIGNGLLALLRHPDQLGRLRDDPALIQSAVEELLRYDSPVQRTARITTTDVEVDGRTLAKGSMVVAAIGAANRDPAHFPDPDRLDITRRDNRHIAFGFGIHFCLGAPLARLEGQIALGTLLRERPGLAGDAPPSRRETWPLRRRRAPPRRCEPRRGGARPGVLADRPGRAEVRARALPVPPEPGRARRARDRGRARALRGPAVHPHTRVAAAAGRMAQRFAGRVNAPDFPPDADW